MVRFGIELGNGRPTELIRNAQLAEQYGFDYTWFADTGLNREVFVTATYVASNTRTLKVGVITNPYTRNPAITATAIATLDEFSGGRAIYALGSGGYNALIPLGVKTWEKPMTAIREAVEVARRLFRGESLTYEGKTCRYKGAQLTFGARKEIPIYIASIAGPKIMETAGRLADGVLFTGPLGVEYTKSCIDGVARAATEAGRDPKELLLSMDLLLTVANDEEVAVERAKTLAARMMITDPRFYRAMKFYNITDKEIKRVQNALSRGNEKVSVSVTEKMVDKFSIAGKPDSCARKLKKYLELGITNLFFMTPNKIGAEDNIRIIAEEIIPKLK